MAYDIIEVPDDAGDSLEPLGTKRKFWYLNEGTLYLFKQRRPDKGDDWTEKVASVLCHMFGLPCATYELAVHKGAPGTICPSFIPEGWRIEHGNEILSTYLGSYPEGSTHHTREYTLGKVFTAIDHFNPSIPQSGLVDGRIETSAELFAGYIMFDTWISNQDRHHENWAFLVDPQSRRFLAPSYDHAASLGTVLRDEEREDRLTTQDRGRTVQRYVERARSAFYAVERGTKRMLSIEAFKFAAARYPQAAQVWSERLGNISFHEVEHVLNDLPEARASTMSRKFALEMMRINQARLLEAVSS